jgi:hypothetical protein
VYHVGGGTLPKGHYNKVHLNFRNNLIMLAKNLPPKEQLWKIPFRIMLDFLFAVKSLLTGDASSFRAVINAHGSFIKWLLNKKGKHAQVRKPLKQLQGVSSKSVVWAYFIEKKTRFTEIIDNKHV